MTEKTTPKRGGARRGPYSGKKMTFTTKLTEGTMKRLTAAAHAAEMSVSQKGEAAIVRGLDAEDDFRLHFAPALAAFEQQMIPSMPSRDGDDDLEAWAIGASARVEALTRKLKEAVLAVVPAAQPGVAEIEPAGPLLAPAPQRKRRLELDD